MHLSALHDAASTTADGDYDALLETITAPTDAPVSLLPLDQALGISMTPALADDDETDVLTAKDLEAMLSLVDDETSTLDALTVDEDAASVGGIVSSDPMVHDAQARRDEGDVKAENTRPHCKSSTSRVRQKQELEYLRAQVIELEAELERIKHASTGSPRSCEENDANEPSVWEQIAKRQADEKHRAEVENIKLRGILEGQLRIAQSLEKLLRKRVPSDSESLFMERKRAKRTDDSSDASLFADIRSRIKYQFDDVGRILNECGISTRTTDLEDSRATCDADGMICMEVTMVKVLPFDFDQVTEAVWQCVSAREIALENGMYGSPWRTETECTVNFTLTLRMRRSKAAIDVKGVGARRVTPDRSMIVFEMVGRAEGPLFGNHRIVCRERGYVLIERDATRTTPSTIARICARLRPEAEQLDDEASAPPQIGLFADLVIGSYNQNSKTMLQYIENLLLERTLTRPSYP